MALMAILAFKSAQLIVNEEKTWNGETNHTGMYGEVANLAKQISR